MGWSNVAGAVLQAVTVIVTAGSPGSGIFVYNGTPATGNLIGSWAAAGGTDPYGNTYPAGIAVGEASGPQVELIPAATLNVLGLPVAGAEALMPINDGNEQHPGGMATGATGGASANPATILSSPIYNITSGARAGNTEYGALELFGTAIDSSQIASASIAVNSGYPFTRELSSMNVFADGSSTLNTTNLTVLGTITFLDSGGILVYSSVTTTVTYSTAGSGTFTVPAAVTSLHVEGWGGGGSGGAPSGHGGGGGGGGEYAAETMLPVSPLEVLSYIVGAGSTTSANGGDTTFSRGGTTLVDAHGGLTSNSTTGMAGGSGSGNSIHFNGGSGGNGSGAGGGGGGGSSAGTAAAGGDGVGGSGGGGGGAGGTAPAGGGNGGQGGTVSPPSAGVNGSAPGGGGGGHSSSLATAGNGANGQLKITYVNSSNLIASIASIAGTDQFGNSYPQGIAIKSGSIVGSPMMSDTAAPNYQLMHVGSHGSGTSTDASGNVTISHGASFTPTGAVVMYDQTGAAGGPYAAGCFNFSSTTFGVHFESNGVSYNSSALNGYHWIVWA